MLYIMRHGQTDWNIGRKIQGVTDIPLNDTGRATAEAMRLAHADLSFDVCYVSPLRRARETADIFLRDRGVPIVVDRRLREMAFGPYEGEIDPMTREDSPLHPFFAAPASYTAPPGAESLFDLYARADSFIAEILTPRRLREESILLVTHGALSLAIINRFAGVPLERFWERKLKNAEVRRIV